MGTNSSQDEQVLTGQVPVLNHETCRKHRETARNAEGTLRWCSYCGWTSADGGKRMAPPSGGW